MNDVRQKKLFISHSAKDSPYVKALVELLEDIGMPESAIICTSVPGYGIPGGQKIYDWLREQFSSCDLLVVYVLSENYYGSAACLNEMGAAWLAKTEDRLVLLPGFEFSDIRGCVDSSKVGISLGGESDELKMRLGELKDKLILDFDLQRLGDSRWERHRDAFIAKVDSIAFQKSGTGGMRVSQEEPNRYSYRGVSVAGSEFPDPFSVDAGILAVYAAKDDGSITHLSTMGGESISAGGYEFVNPDTPRQEARWMEALDTLVAWKWATSLGSKRQVFRLTNTGFNWADYLLDDMEIDTAKSPHNQIKKFEGD